ncbi:hypothetical protein J1G33_20375 [Pseudomonas sp. P867]|uniref:hypothetical protein n=1 Tax=Pseudomonas sp. P867 TaxID=2816050 RepID=UPI001CA73F18|nr:hypothetical protein [Pseudomonas sp. P867]
MYGPLAAESLGEKILEVLRWHPDLDPSEDLLIVESERFLHNDGDDSGIAVAIMRVKAMRPFIFGDVHAACATYFQDGWLAWELSDVRPVTHLVTIHLCKEVISHGNQTVGIDLVKNVVQIHGMNERGKHLLRKQLKRDQMALFFANLTPCLTA